MYQNFEKHVLKAQSRAWEISNNLKAFKIDEKQVFVSR